MRIKECQQLAGQMEKLDSEIEGLRARLAAALADRDKAELSLQEAHHLLGTFSRHHQQISSRFSRYPDDRSSFGGNTLKNWFSQRCDLERLVFQLQYSISSILLHPIVRVLEFWSLSGSVSRISPFCK